MRAPHAVLGLALVATIAAASAGCGSSAPASFHPTLAWTTCPADVEAAFLSAHRCGYLTVLEDRTRPDGRRLRLLLVQVKPASGRVLPGAATSIDGDLGDAPRLDADASAYALRLHRTVVRMEPRGAGLHASPSLRCPEVDQLQARAVRSPTGDPALTAAFVGAVRACASRLHAQGVDLAAYDAEAQAADLEDLRTTLGLSGWAVMGSYGSNDVALWDYLAAYPQRVRAAFSDSPSFPGEDPLVSQVRETKDALHQLFRLCVHEPGCAQRHPDLGGLWNRALRRLTAHPLRGTGAAGGRRIPVLVDAGRLLRTARFALGGDGPGNVAGLPAMIDAAAHGRLDPHLADLVAADPVFCAGYRPQCPAPQNFAIGSFLTTFCRAQLPMADASALQRATAGVPAYDQVFGRDPYVAACGAWPVGRTTSPSPTTTTGTPLLLMSGQLDSFSSPALGAALTTRQAHAWALTIPGQTHNVLGFSDCAITIRNDWTLHPRRPRPVASCQYPEVQLR